MRRNFTEILGCMGRSMPQKIYKALVIRAGLQGEVRVLVVFLRRELCNLENAKTHESVVAGSNISKDVQNVALKNTRVSCSLSLGSRFFSGVFATLTLQPRKCQNTRFASTKHHFSRPAPPKKTMQN